MCKTGTLKRPLAVPPAASATAIAMATEEVSPQQQEQFESSLLFRKQNPLLPIIANGTTTTAATVSGGGGMQQVPSFFPQFYNPQALVQFGALQQQIMNESRETSSRTVVANSTTLFPQPFMQPPNAWTSCGGGDKQVFVGMPSLPPLPSSRQVISSTPSLELLVAASRQANFLGSVQSMAAIPMQLISSVAPISSSLSLPQVPRSNFGLQSNGLSTQPKVQGNLKRPTPEIVPDSNSEHSGSDDSERVSSKKRAKSVSATKRKHEATLDGERRVAIEFESYGTVGPNPQKYGKGALLVPDGVSGKYSAFGQRWKFTINHSGDPVVCEDGITRVCLGWSVINLNSGVTHTVNETPVDAMRRDRDGKTLCNRVFREALSLRANALEEEIKARSDHSSTVDLHCQLRTIQTKRFSEGPLFFGLRHASLQNELHKQMKATSARPTLSTQRSSQSSSACHSDVPLLGGGPNII